MQIFLSHAHEQAALADALAVSLRQEGHEVFLDVDALQKAQAFHAEIRERLRASDLFIFLLSPQALEAGSYALTELGEARARWPNPSGHVLPVLAVPVDFETIPPYLKAVTVLSPKGDVVAETARCVADLDRPMRRRRWQRRLGAGAAIGAVGGVLAWLWPGPNAPDDAPCLLRATLSESPSNSTRVTTLEAGAPGQLRSFVVSGDEASLDVGPLTPTDARWIIEASAADGRIVAAFNVDGCPRAPLELNHDGSRLQLRLTPRH